MEVVPFLHLPCLVSFSLGLRLRLFLLYVIVIYLGRTWSLFHKNLLFSRVKVRHKSKNPEFQSTDQDGNPRNRKERLLPNSELKLTTPIEMEIPSPLNTVGCFVFLSLLVVRSSARDGDAACDTYMDD
mmetsp:Transcript_11824/g.28371  ORF Transcript_11824/g.28371 Transcript_11824/m.28371 type:complete len:128 (-) Transcript_11824:12-395(-)